MINLILEVIKNDTEIISLINPIVNNLKIYSMGTTYIGDCIVYNYIQLLNDGIKAQDRLEITVHSNNEAKANQIVDRVKQLLITVGDWQKVNGILEISQSGGGSLFDDETKVFKVKAFFVVKSKSKIKL